MINSSKICIKCKVEKELSDFYFRKESGLYRNDCKKCNYEGRKERRLRNLEHSLDYEKNYRLENSEQIKIKNEKYRELNKEKLKEKSKKYRELNRDNILKKLAEWRLINRPKKDKISEEEKLLKKTEYSKNYYLTNKKTIIKQNIARERERKKTDLIFLLRKKIKNNIVTAIKRSKYSKNKNTIDILGIDILGLKNYLESKFEPWMSWENHGKYNGGLNYGWDIDHIIPVSSARNEEELIKLNHYTNLQPLCSKVNRDIKRSLNEKK
jgi:hypothetical protein